MYVPVFAGLHYPRLAIEAAQRLLELTGHRDAKGSWLQVGGAVHKCSAFVGVVGCANGRPTDFTALGDDVNITARLASYSGAGEILISDAAYTASHLDLGALEYRQLELKGRSEPTGVRVIRSSAA